VITFYPALLRQFSDYQRATPFFENRFIEHFSWMVFLTAFMALEVFIQFLWGIAANNPTLFSDMHLEAFKGFPHSLGFVPLKMTI
jgi:hypothetical protein